MHCDASFFPPALLATCSVSDCEVIEQATTQRIANFGPLVQRCSRRALLAFTWICAGNVHNCRVTLAANVVVIDRSASRVLFFHRVHLLRRRTRLTPNLPAVETRGIEAFHATIFNGMPNPRRQPIRQTWLGRRGN